MNRCGEILMGLWNWAINTLPQESFLVWYLALPTAVWSRYYTRTHIPQGFVSSLPLPFRIPSRGHRNEVRAIMHLDGHKPNETGLPAGDRPSLHSGIPSWIIHGRSEIFFHVFFSSKSRYSRVKKQKASFLICPHSPSTWYRLKT